MLKINLFAALLICSTIADASEVKYPREAIQVANIIKECAKEFSEASKDAYIGSIISSVVNSESNLIIIEFRNGIPTATTDSKLVATLEVLSSWDPFSQRPDKPYSVTYSCKVVRP